MNQQEAQTQYNERLKAFQEENLFDNKVVSEELHPYYLAALRDLSVMQLKVALDTYKASLEVKEVYSLNIAGLILHVVEKATPKQLGVNLEDYASLMELCADAATAWQEAVTPFATELMNEINAKIEAEKPAAPLPKIKELHKRRNQKPTAEA